MESFIIEVYVDNHYGVLGKVVALFSKRGYNIESLNVCKTADDEKISRMEIEVIGDDYAKEQLCKQLRKLYVVRKAELKE